MSPVKSGSSVEEKWVSPPTLYTVGRVRVDTSRKGKKTQRVPHPHPRPSLHRRPTTSRHLGGRKNPPRLRTRSTLCPCVCIHTGTCEHTHRSRRHLLRPKTSWVYLSSPLFLGWRRSEHQRTEYGHPRCTRTTGVLSA